MTHKFIVTAEGMNQYVCNSEQKAIKFLQVLKSAGKTDAYIEEK